jgi:hypothetical protein
MGFSTHPEIYGPLHQPLQPYHGVYIVDRSIVPECDRHGVHATEPSRACEYMDNAHIVYGCQILSINAELQMDELLAFRSLNRVGRLFKDPREASPGIREQNEEVDSLA